MSSRSNRFQGLPTQTGEDRANKLPRSGAAENQNQEGHMPTAPAPPELLELMAVMEKRTQLMQKLANSIATYSSQGNQQPASPPRNNMISDFVERQPSEFAGSFDNPIEAEDWLRDMEMKLEDVGADEQDKVRLAATKLKGSALSWWYTQRELNPNARAMVWDEFVKEFRGYHMPSSIMNFKRNEFRDLRQGGMTVMEYLRKFNELSRYAPEDVNTDEKKQITFLVGLNAELTIQQDFYCLVNKAIAIEDLENNEHNRKFKNKRKF